MCVYISNELPCDCLHISSSILHSMQFLGKSIDLMGLKTKILAAHRRTSTTSMVHMKQSVTNHQSFSSRHRHSRFNLEHVGENGALCLSLHSFFTEHGYYLEPHKYTTTHFTYRRHLFENLYCFIYSGNNIQLSSPSLSLSADLLNINPSRKAKREYGFCTLFLHNRRLLLYLASTAAEITINHIVSYK